MRLHFDRRDSVHLTGKLYNVGLSFLTFDLTWQNSIPIGNQVASQWDDSNGHCIQMTLYFNVQKVGDLTD